MYTVDELRFASERYVRRVAAAESEAWRTGRSLPLPPQPPEGEPDIFSEDSLQVVRAAVDAAAAAGERRVLGLLGRGLLAGALDRAAGPALRAAAASTAAHVAFHGVAELGTDEARVPGPAAARAERSALQQRHGARLAAWRGSSGAFLSAARELDQAAARLGVGDPDLRLSTLARVDPEALVASASHFLDATEGQLSAALEAASAAHGLDPLPQHLPVLFNLPDLEHRFTAARMLPVAGTVLLQAGVDVLAERRLEVVSAPRSRPRPTRAFPLRLPGLAQVVVHRAAGLRSAQLHLLELGHALHWLGTDPGPFPYRWPFGHRAISDGYGLLLAGLLTQPEVLHARGMPAEVAAAVARVCRRSELLHLRTAAALVVDDPLALGTPEAYARSLARARGVPVPAEEAEAWPVRVDRVYAAETYQSWLLMSSLVARLRREVGPDWRARRETGELWAQWISGGQRLSVGELLTALTQGDSARPALDPAPLLDWLGAASS